MTEKTEKLSTADNLFRLQFDSAVQGTATVNPAMTSSNKPLQKEQHSEG